MTVTIWIQKEELEKFKKFYDDVNKTPDSKLHEIEKPNIKFYTFAPVGKTLLQVNVLYDIYVIMDKLLNEQPKQTEKSE
jgi:hypothetical protein